MYTIHVRSSEYLQVTSIDQSTNIRLLIYDWLKKGQVFCFPLTCLFSDHSRSRKEKEKFFFFNSTFFFLLIKIPNIILSFIHIEKDSMRFFSM